MISLIICSRKSDTLAQLRQNIDETIGCDHELVIIDNSKNLYTIFSAYNKGAKLAKGDILCFCHEDILFHTKSWGMAIIDILKDESIGELGVIGTHFLPAAPLYWWSSPFISQYSINNDNGRTTFNDTRDYFCNHIADVVAVDGVCFFIRRSMFSHIRFDDKTYNGFHAYDMDISMQVLKTGKRVCVTDLLLVEHFWSQSSFEDIKYLAKLDDNMVLFYNKWKESLPITRGIDEPEIVIHRVNTLCIHAYEASRIRRSRAYRLGRFLLRPIKRFRGK